MAGEDWVVPRDSLEHKEWDYSGYKEAPLPLTAVNPVTITVTALSFKKDTCSTQKIYEL